MDQERPYVPPADTTAREFALQLAVIAQRLDERSAFAVERVEAAAATLERQGASAARTLEAERNRSASTQQGAAAARARLPWIASIVLLAGTLVAAIGTTLAVASAKRELVALNRDRELLQAINTADLTLCGDRLCARLERGAVGEGEGGEYRPVAARPARPPSLQSATRYE
ncbi:hypothetical protein WCE41_11570 [Luteimonas sp. MJ246]|uniref:hypothetical protein n=1 Tax=Luteimonas sp. MJ174 TaxID=3129237 RepID=UPI0031BB43C6